MKHILSCLIFCFAALLPAAAHAQRAVSDVRTLNPTAVEVLYNDGGMLTIDFYGENIFRLFEDPNGGIIRNPEADPPAQILVDSPRLPVSVSLQRDGADYVLSTPAIQVRIAAASGLISVVRSADGTAVLEQVDPVKFEAGRTTLAFRAHSDEYFYGGGVQNGRFSHKGKSIAIENSNNWVDGGVASPTPFYWSTQGYGLLWHTFKPGRYDFGETAADRAEIAHNTDYLDIFLMFDSEPELLLSAFYQLTGRPVLLPKFAFYEGHLNAYNRDYWTPAENGFMTYEDGLAYNESQKDNGGTKESLNGEKGNYQFSARAAIDRYAAADMPLGWFLPNDGYGAGYGQTETLDGNIANLKSFGDYARSKGVEIGLWTQSDLHPKAGVEALLQRDIVKEVRDAGVRVLKTDVAWVGNGYSFGLNGVADVGNVMPYYGNNARPFIISLDGWAGTQRYAGIWTGDQTGGDWEYIRFHIPTFIGSGLSGQPNITNDMDGIFGGKNVAVNVRDFQWKTFTPMELNMDGWGSNPKYPQALGEPATSINRSYLKLKSQLLPYTYSIAHEATQGKPMVRALFLDYPNAFTLSDKTQFEFLYGPSFLVAPIYKNTAADADGNDVRNEIYLPEGTWIDYFDGTAYAGGRLLSNFDAPLWKLPVFVRSAAIIPMTRANNNPNEIPADYRAYEIYPDGDCCFVEYDDDGRTEEYKQSRSTYTEIRTTRDAGRLSIEVGATRGDFSGFEPQKQTEFFVNLSAKPKKVVAKIAGKKVALSEAASREAYERGENVFFFDKAPNLNRFATRGSDFAKVEIRKNPQLLIKIAKTNTAANDLSISLDGVSFDTSDRLLRSHGALSAPQVGFSESDITPNALTPSWQPVENADYYEVQFDGQTYSTIRQNRLTFDGLQPETDYAFSVRAANADGFSAWTPASAQTLPDPYRFAFKGVSAQCTAAAQPGQGVGKLFDGDHKTAWHTDWSNREAVPFDLTLDLHAVGQIDKIEYLPREDAGNGTLLAGSVSTSIDRQTWTPAQSFAWERNGETKTLTLNGIEARYVRLHIDQAVGGYGSGREIYVYRVPGTEATLQGDINKDGRIDENDLTSYMNYTGLRRGDSDFDYVSAGDVNNNGLIDAYDISVVATQLDGGVSAQASDKAAGRLALSASKTTFNAGDEITISVSGEGLRCVNALSFALPYDAALLEYVGLEPTGMKDMVNLTYDRLHTSGQKELFPCFVNKGNNFLLEDGPLFTLKFRARKAGTFAPRPARRPARRPLARHRPRLLMAARKKRCVLAWGRIFFCLFLQPKQCDWRTGRARSSQPPN